MNIKKDKKARKKMYLENQIEEEEFVQKMKEEQLKKEAGEEEEFD